MERETVIPIGSILYGIFTYMDAWFLNGVHVGKYTVRPLDFTGSWVNSWKGNLQIVINAPQKKHRRNHVPFQELKELRAE